MLEEMEKRLTNKYRLKNLTEIKKKLVIIQYKSIIYEYNTHEWTYLWSTFTTDTITTKDWNKLKFI